MFNTQNTMRRMRRARRMSRDAMRRLVAAGGLCAVAGGARAESIHPDPGSAVAELRRVSATVGDGAGLVSVGPEVLLGATTATASFGDFVSHSNNTRFVLNGSGAVSTPLASLLDLGAHRIGLVEDTLVSATVSPVVAIPAPGVLWLAALGTMCTRRRRRRA